MIFRILPIAPIVIAYLLCILELALMLAVRNEGSMRQEYTK